MKRPCDCCREIKKTNLCHNEISCNTECNNNVCSDCCILCEKCDKRICYKKDIEKMCQYCCIICNKCIKSICSWCHWKYGRCKDCWSESPLCEFCQDSKTEADYECDGCYQKVCYSHKKRCYKCGTKCMDCHENYYKASCEDCRGDLSPDDVEEPDDIK